MTSEEALLKSGFSKRDLQKLKNNIENYGGSFDSVTHDLANRFKAMKWITIIAFIILALTLLLASRGYKSDTCAHVIDCTTFYLVYNASKTWLQILALP
jgi:hypothetical protein